MPDKAPSSKHDDISQIAERVNKRVMSGNDPTSYLCRRLPSNTSLRAGLCLLVIVFLQVISTKESTNADSAISRNVIIHTVLSKGNQRDLNDGTSIGSGPMMTNSKIPVVAR